MPPDPLSPPRRARRPGATDVSAARTDVLFQLPLRYEDWTAPLSDAARQPGASGLVEGTVARGFETARPRRAFVAVLTDGTGREILSLRFLHVFPGLRSRFAPGQRIAAYGRLRQGPHGLEMVHPRCRRAPAAGAPRPRSLEPVYSARGPIPPRARARLVRDGLAHLAHDPSWTDTLTPIFHRSGLDVPSLTESLSILHAPPAEDNVEHVLEQARRRLAAEELTAHILRTRLWRRGLNDRPAPALVCSSHLVDRYLAQLPWRPTEGQQRAFEEIRADLRRAQPMIRVLQGDVGCGKTLVAVLAALHTLEAGEQVALLAPTEILARQHHDRLAAELTPLGITVLGLWGTIPAGQRRVHEAKIATRDPCLTVGTHALLHSRLHFGSLGLVIVDEQHRFGVVQRQTLNSGRSDALQPHQLIMTATPIPRTLALALYGGIDLTTIHERPPGRTPVRTTVLPDTRRRELMARLRHRCLEGSEQAYWICPWIGDEDDTAEDEGPGVARTYHELLTHFPPDSLALVHGRMSARAREEAMRLFHEGRARILVATTVVEVGVDVPAATIMVIEEADRLGLLQLHQLRGRVGRGTHPSHCVLLHKSLRPEAGARLESLTRLSDGLDVARQDLETRGPGDATGTRQSGLPGFRFVDLARDLALVPFARRVADAIMPEGALAPHGEAERLLARWPGPGETLSRTV